MLIVIVEDVETINLYIGVHDMNSEGHWEWLDGRPVNHSIGSYS